MHSAVEILEQLDAHGKLRRAVEVGVHATGVGIEALLRHRYPLSRQRAYDPGGVGHAEGDVVDAFALLIEVVAPDARFLAWLDQLDDQLPGLEKGELCRGFRRLAANNVLARSKPGVSTIFGIGRPRASAYLREVASMSCTTKAT